MPVFYVIVFRFKLPESPRWLRLKGKDKEADAVLTIIHGSTELPKTIEGIDSDKYIERIFSSLERAKDKSKNKENSFKTIWSKKYIRRTSMLWILWFSTGFAYYGFFTFAPTLLVDLGYTIVTSLGVSLLSYIMQTPGYFSAAYIAEKIGRKALLAFFMLAGAVVAIALAYSRNFDSIIILYALMSFFLNGLFGGVYIYTPEQYPTEFRTSGMGYASSFARVGAIISPILFGTLILSIHFSGVFIMSFIIMLIGALAVIILGKETTSQDLEATSSPDIIGESA